MAAGKVALRTFQKRKDLEEEGESQAKSPPCCGSEETKELQRPGAGPGAPILGWWTDGWVSG